MSLEKLRLFNTKENAEKKEHLKSEVLPIFCTVEDFETMDKPRLDEINELISRADSVDYYGSTQKRDSINAKYHPDFPYIISDVNDHPKHSYDFRDCQGIVVAGRGVNGNEISFIAHYSPYTFSKAEYFESFKKHLQESIHTLQAQTEQGTIDAVTIGGQYATGTGTQSAFDKSIETADEYLLINESVSEALFQELGFKPAIAEGPNLTMNAGEEDNQNGQRLIYDTQHRHLHVIIKGATQHSGKTFTLEEIQEHHDDFSKISSAERKKYKKQLENE